MSIRTAHFGAALSSPISRLSPRRGGSSNAATSSPRSSSCLTFSADSPPTGALRTATSPVGTIARSSCVEKTTALSVSVRTVDTIVPRRITIGDLAGVDSQNVTGTRAGVGGSRRTPSSSRNLTYNRSGTRLSR